MFVFLSGSSSMDFLTGTLLNLIILLSSLSEILLTIVLFWSIDLSLLIYW
jgi:hypothetical protein